MSRISIDTLALNHLILKLYANRLISMNCNHAKYQTLLCLAYNYQFVCFISHRNKFSYCRIFTNINGVS